MQNNLIFWPALGQIALTIGLYFVLAKRKNAAVAEGTVDEERRGLHDDAWPDAVVQVNNCIRNQFELPILFYVLVIALWQTGTTPVAALAAAWLFLLARIGHAVVHTGSNFVPLRRKLFTVSAVLIIVLMGLTAFGLLQP